jgi:hypothetical protein
VTLPRSGPTPAPGRKSKRIVARGTRRTPTDSIAIERASGGGMARRLRHSSGEQIEDERNPHAMAAGRWDLAPMALRVVA